jgi:hypothetical protein
MRNARKLVEERTAGSDPGIRSSSRGPISLGPCLMTLQIFFFIYCYSCLDNERCENRYIITAHRGRVGEWGLGGGAGWGGRGWGVNICNYTIIRFNMADLTDLRKTC